MTPLNCTWDDVHEIAAELICERDGEFNEVWSTSAELAWANRAWDALTRKGLTTYENPPDLAYIQLQLLTLAAMFCRFLELIYEKPIIIDYHSWFLDSKIEFVHLQTMFGEELTEEFRNEDIYSAQLLQNHTEIAHGDLAPDSIYEDISPEKVSVAINSVIRQQSRSVFETLVSEFNGVSLLSLSLLQTQLERNVFSWIEEGMRPECNMLNKGQA